MTRTWFNTAVVFLWLATMTWLVSQKVVPTLLVGEPPSYRSVVEAQQQDPLVGWTMAWNGQQVGWAMNTTSPLEEGLTEVGSLIRFEELPLREMMAGWPDWLLKLLSGGGEVPTGLQIQVKSSLTFDPLQRLSQFESSVGFPAAQNLVKVKGSLDGPQLMLTVHTGNFNYKHEILLPRKVLLSDALSPQTQLPGLREGQSWSIEVYSPLRPPDSPLEIFQATVEGSVPIVWDGRMVDTWLVVYRSDPGAGTASSRSPRRRLWVGKDGTVLKQEVRLFDSTMTLTRMAGHQARALADSVGRWQ